MGPIAGSNPSCMPLIFPLLAATCIDVQSWRQQSLAHRLVVCWILLRAVCRACRFLSDGKFWSAERPRLFCSRRGNSSSARASNQSADMISFLPKVDMTNCTSRWHMHWVVQEVHAPVSKRTLPPWGSRVLLTPMCGLFSYFTLWTLCFESCKVSWCPCFSVASMFVVDHNDLAGIAKFL